MQSTCPARIRLMLVIPFALAMVHISTPYRNEMRYRFSPQTTLWAQRQVDGTGVGLSI